MRIRSKLGIVFRLAGVGFTAIALQLTMTNAANAVANGVPVQNGQYPFSVKLVMTGIPRDATVYDSACSGALIAPQWIISAGHCFHTAVVNGSSQFASGKIGTGQPIPYASTKAILGRATLTGTTGHEVGVVEAYQAGVNDIAIAKLATPIWDIAPLVLPRSAPKIDDIVRIAGWGSLDATPNTAVPQMHTGQMKVTSVAGTVIGVKGYLPYPNTSACLYDSGAAYFSEPTVGRPQVVGIESDGPGCPHDQEETLARVDVVAMWIYLTMREHL